MKKLRRTLKRGAGCWMFIVALLAIPLSGSAQVGVAPVTLNFGSVLVGNSSAPQVVTVSNTGTANLTFSSIQLSQAGFAISAPSLPLSLAPGHTFQISVTYQPTSAISIIAWLWIFSSSPNSPSGVPLSGTGVAVTSSTPQVSVGPTSISCGTQLVGTTSTAKTLTVTNTGTVSATVSSITSNNSDFIVTAALPATLAPSQSLQASITFRPASSGSFSGSILVYSNAQGSPNSITASGIGVTSSGAVAALSSSSLAFGSGPVTIASSPQAVTLTNTGGSALSITSIATTGADATDFVENNTCGSSVAAGSRCTITISFRPSATGTRTASLTITDNASGSPQSAALSEHGIHDVILAWGASSGPGLAGYYVYRGTTSGRESLTPLNSPLNSATSFVDANVQAGATYYYVVVAVGSNGLFSANSNEVSANIPSP